MHDLLSCTAYPAGTSPLVLAGCFQIIIYVSQENTTGTVLYSLRGSVKESDYVCNSNESLTRESVYLWPVTGCWYRARARIYTASHKFNTIGEICCKWSMRFYALPFVLSVEPPVIPLIMQKLQYQETFP